MATYEINFSSITYAMKAQRLLQESGLSARLERNVKAGYRDGCGYHIVISCSPQRAQEAMALLRKKGVPVKSVEAGRG